MHYMTQIRAKGDKRKSRENNNVWVWMKTHTMPLDVLKSYRGRQRAASDLDMSVGRFTKALERVLMIGMGRPGRPTPEHLKGRNRNKLCPCESGIKTKLCCGGINADI